MNDLKTDLPLTNIHLIKKNPYCAIYRATCEQETVIVKHYVQDQEKLVANEAKSVALYQKIAARHHMWFDCKVIECNVPRGVLVVSFVPGTSLSHNIYHSKNKQQLLENVVSLGKLLASMYQETQQTGTLDSFFYEYIDYCQQKLQAVRGVRKHLIKRYHFPQVKKLHSVNISFSHGDFVPANIHVEKDKIGLIDFANSNDRTHIVNDIINFRIAINNMLIAKSLKRDILQALHRGIGELIVDPAVVDLFRAFHYYRWLMLNINSKNPLALLNVWQNARRFSQEKF